MLLLQSHQEDAFAVTLRLWKFLYREGPILNPFCSYFRLPFFISSLVFCFRFQPLRLPYLFQPIPILCFSPHFTLFLAAPGLLFFPFQIIPQSLISFLGHKGKARFHPTPKQYHVPMPFLLM
jgi:hypothetical protein